MNITSVSFLFSTVKEKNTLERNRKINQYENELNLLKSQISKSENPFNMIIKAQSIVPLTLKNKIKLFNRSIAICDNILRKTNMYRDILNQTLNINEEFIVNIQTLKLINNIYSTEEFTNFYNDIILKNEILKKNFNSKIKINEEIINIINYKIPSSEEQEEMIITSIKILGGDHLKKLDLKNINIVEKEEKKNDYNNFDINYGNLKEDINSNLKINEKINYHDSKVKLHIQNIINKLKEI